MVDCIQNVYPHAQIIGIDENAVAVEICRSQNISDANFVQISLATFNAEGIFGAIIGRLALIYLS